VADLQRHIFYIFIAAVLIGVGLSIVLARSVALRVAELVKAMKRVEQGRLSERLHPTGNDELDILARQFNVMVEQLDQNDQTIRDLNTGLERKVKRRTRQLSRSRRSLKRSLVKLTEYDRLKTEFFSNVSHEMPTRSRRKQRPCSRWSASMDSDCST
jgi:nitrate/nitrite-specific signal transduction histidine kinase